jgi:hypothetical protein
MTFLCDLFGHIQKGNHLMLRVISCYTIGVFCFLLLSEAGHGGQGKERMYFLEKELEVGRDQIGMIQGIDVDQKGRIYIGDLVRSTVHLFSENGDYIRAIGKKGRGPAEFSYLWGTRLTKDDSLYVLDGASHTITVFAPERFDYPARTIALPPASDGYMPTLTGSIATGHTGLWCAVKSKYLLVPYATSYSGSNLSDTRYIRLYCLDEHGRFVNNEPVLKIRDKQMLVMQGEGFSVSPMPLGHRPMIYLDQHARLYYGDTDSSSIQVRELTGRMLRAIAVPSKRIRITRRMWERELTRWPDKKLTMEVLERSRNPLPEYMPTFEAFFADDEGNFWIGVNTEDPLTLQWLVLQADGKRFASFQHSKDVMLQLVRRDHAYGIFTDDNGLQSVVRYRIIKRNL